MWAGVKNLFQRLWGQLSLRRKGIVCLSLPVAALLLNSALLYRFDSAKQTAQLWLVHTFQVQIQLEHILTGLSTVAVDSRTYKLTNDQAALARSRQGTQAVLAAVDAVQALTVDNPAHQRRIPQLREAIAHRLQYLARRATTSEPLPLTGQIRSEAEHGSILELITRMAQEEAALMATRTDQLSRMQNLEVATGAITFLLGVASGFLGIWLFLNGVARRLSAAGEQVLQLAGGIPIERTDWHHDEIGSLCAGVERTSALLIERDLTIRDANARVEQTAALGERRFQALVHVTAQMVWTTDGEGRFSARSSGLHGAADSHFQALVKDGWRQSIQPDDRAAVEDALAERKSYECEFQLAMADGSYREFHLRGMPVLEPDGNLREWIQTASDVTEANRAAAMRRQLAAIVKSSDDAIISINMEGLVTSWNKGAENVFGYTAEELLGRSIGLLMPGPSDDMDLDRRCVEAGMAILNRDTLRRHKNGSLITVALTVSPIYDETGRIIGVSKIARDVTAQRHDEALLVQQAHLLEQAYEAMIAWEPSGLIVYWNRGAQDLYGFSREQAVGQNIHQLLQTRHPSPLLEVEEELVNRRLWIGELEHVTSEGLSIVVESRQKRLDLPGGRSLILESNNDITMRKQAENAMRQINEMLEHRVAERTRQLSEANTELEAFCYSVSHDLRAPLRSVEGFAKILVRDHGGTLNETALNLVNRMRAATLRMGQLIEDLLGLSKISRSEIHRQPVDLSKLAAAVMDDLSSSHPERKVEIEVEPGLTAKADPRLVRVALENLLGNAWKFTAKSETPRVSFGVSSANGDTPSYFIRDNGAGFDMAFADQLFAPFQRLHSASEFEGTGIGLATVQRIIHRHEGKIWADSGPGKGATFFFTLGNYALKETKET